MHSNPRSLVVLFALLLQGCGGSDPASDIVDIGKSCDSASDCDHVCVVERGASVGQCSLECDDNADCPSFMDCVTSSSTGERRCFDNGAVGSSLEVVCRDECFDLNYFCSTAAVTADDEMACKTWCATGSEAELEGFIECVDGTALYDSACPAIDCLGLTR